MIQQNLKFELLQHYNTTGASFLRKEMLQSYIQKNANFAQQQYNGVC